MIMQVKAGNSVMVAGTVTKDAEYKTIGENDTPLTSFSLAVNARGEPPAYANCKAFGGVLANYARDIKKGDAVFASGVLESREYNGKTYHDINCQWLNFVGKSGSTQTAYAPSAIPPIHQPEPSGFTSFDDPADDDEELPF